MNLQDQLGVLESSLDTLLEAAAVSARPAAQSTAQPATQPAAASVQAHDAPADDAAPSEPPALAEPAAPQSEPPAEPPALNEKPTLTVSRPERDLIEMTIAGKSVLLSPEGVSELIEQLSIVRASMTVEQPAGIPPGWRFASTKNPVIATQKQANGDRLLVLRHTGYGWVPFTFSPDMVIELYASLTQR